MRAALLLALLAGAASAAPAHAPNIAPATLETLRTAGDRVIPPDAETQRKIIAAHAAGATVSYVVCLDDHGNLESAELLKSSSYREWDDKVYSTMFGTWRFRPYERDGKPTAVCSAITQLFKTPSAPPPPAPPHESA